MRVLLLFILGLTGHLFAHGPGKENDLAGRRVFGDSDNERNIWLIAHGQKLAKDKLLNEPTPQAALVP